MTPVSLKKVDRDEAASLQEMCKIYSEHILTKINPEITIKYYDYILEADILSEMYFLFRNKIEGPHQVFTVTLKVAQAVVLIYALNHCKHTDNLYASGVITKFWNAIDKNLKDRIIIKPKTPLPVKLLSQPHVIE